MNSWTVEGVLFLTAHKTSPVSKAVVPVYISLSRRAPLFQIHPSVIPPIISLSKQSQCVVIIYLCVCMQAQACPSTHVRGHLAGAGGLNSHLSDLGESSFNDQDFLTDLFFWCFLFVYLFCGYRFSLHISVI